MKYPITRFKSLTLALKELEPYIRNGEHLQTGKPFKTLGGMRSREALANWLLCVVGNTIEADRYTFTSDPLGGDGLILDNTTGEVWPTEHVLVPLLPDGPPTGGAAEALVLQAVADKQAKGGTAYASGKTLVVFVNAVAGPYVPNRLARNLPDDLAFAGVWVVGLQYVEEGRYTYGVTLLDRSGLPSPTFRIHVAATFDSWEVERRQ